MGNASESRRENVRREADNDDEEVLNPAAS